MRPKPRRAVARRLALGTTGAVAGAYTATWLRIRRVGRPGPDTPADVAVVFGAAVWASGASPELIARVDRAAQAHADGKVGMILCIGGRDGEVSEAAVMRERLVARGVAPEAILVDDRGANSRVALEAAASLARNRWRTFLLVSSPYHLHRLTAEAARRGMVAAPAAAVLRPVPRLRRDLSPSQRRLLIYQLSRQLREVLAVWWYALPFRLSTVEVRKAAAGERASAAVADLLRRRQASGGSSRRPGRPLALSAPVAAEVTSGFGWRSPRHHDGVDFAAGHGAPVRAAASGTVVYAGGLPMYGLTVVIGHDARLATLYGHLSRLTVEAGEELSAGQVLGSVGSSGNAFGSHLHFEVRIDAEPVDPTAHLKLVVEPPGPMLRGPTKGVWILRRLLSLARIDDLAAALRRRARR